MMLGTVAAEKLKKNPGDEMDLFPGKTFRVVGIYTVGIPWENVAAVVSTRAIQDKLKMGIAVRWGFSI